MRCFPEAREAVARWRWETAESGSDLTRALVLSHGVVDRLAENRLGDRCELAVDWTHASEDVSRFTSLLLRARTTPPDELAARALANRPAVAPDAVPLRLTFQVYGGISTSDGGGRADDRIIEVSTAPGADRLGVEVRVFHDVWAERDFSGNPHPEVHELNAPRLAVGLRAVEQALGFPGSPGGPTFFGTPFNYGVRAHVAEDGTGVDVSDHL